MGWGAATTAALFLLHAKFRFRHQRCMTTYGLYSQLEKRRKIIKPSLLYTLYYFSFFIPTLRQLLGNLSWDKEVSVFLADLALAQIIFVFVFVFFSSVSLVCFALLILMLLISFLNLGCI